MLPISLVSTMNWLPLGRSIGMTSLTGDCSNTVYPFPVRCFIYLRSFIYLRAARSGNERPLLRVGLHVKSPRNGTGALPGVLFVDVIAVRAANRGRRGLYVLYRRHRRHRRYRLGELRGRRARRLQTDRLLEGNRIA